jgi:hypothetical protein
MVATVANPALLAPPMRLESSRGDGRSYRRVYAFAADRPGDWVQTVTVAVHYRVGGRVVVDYRARYHEFFAVALHGVGTVVRDVHDFDLWRDGWRQAAIRDWLDVQCRARGSMPGGAPELLVRKRFVLRRAALAAHRAEAVAPGVGFGFLRDGPGGPTALCVRLFGTSIQLPAGMGAVPKGLPAAGRAEPAPGPVFGTVERFTHRFACLTGVVNARDGYRQLPETVLPATVLPATPATVAPLSSI